MSARLRAAVGQCALVAFLVTFVTPLIAGVHLLPSDDEACGPSALGPRHPASQFETARDAAAPAAHCETCHWIRALTGAAPARTALAEPPLAACGLGGGAPAWWDGTAVLSGQPPRAPPSVL
jgi:hypothetical protein